jgi:hypothetical protein
MCQGDVDEKVDMPSFLAHLYMKHADMVDIILDMKNDFGVTPLMLAAIHRSTRMQRALRSIGAKIGPTDPYGLDYRALTHLCAGGSLRDALLKTSVVGELMTVCHHCGKMDPSVIRLRHRLDQTPGKFVYCVKSFLPCLGCNMVAFCGLNCYMFTNHGAKCRELRALRKRMDVLADGNQLVRLCNMGAVELWDDEARQVVKELKAAFQEELKLLFASDYVKRFLKL